VTNEGWETLSNQAVAGAGVVYFLALLSYLVQWASLRGVGAASVRGVDAVAESPAPSRRADMTGRLGLLLLGLGCALHLVSLVGRGMAADPNRVPWGNMYEFTLSGTFVVALIFLLTRRRLGLDWAAPLVVSIVLTLLMVAVIWLYDPVAPLTEALNSYWLVIHVVSAIIATGTFTLGGLCSILYLVKERRPDRRSGFLSRVPDPPMLDRTAYRLHAFAFPVWTFAVLITGPIWAHEAWASYWSWDPKEVWAFITWVVYAAYLHARATAGWRGRNAAYLALLGVATLWFNFVGINYFSTNSQHSYASGTPAISRTHDVR
jgi:cytochrome c-type biogenesis protein CcsB